MDWAHPYLLLLFLPLAALAVLFHWRSTHPMPAGRRRALLVVRLVAVALCLLALAGPAYQATTREEAVIFVIDQSQSLGDEGIEEAYAAANRLADALPGSTRVGFVSAGSRTDLLRMPGEGSGEMAPPSASLIADAGGDSDLAGAVRFAAGLFPAGTSRRIVYVGDGLETRGDLALAAREAGVSGVVIDALPIAGPARPDVRVVSLTPSRSRLHEGAHLALTATIESSIQGTGVARLFENGVEQDSQPITLDVGETKTVTFDRTPDSGALYKYRVRVDGFEGDTIPANDAAQALVDVRGRPLWLYIEGDPGEARYLTDAMAEEGIRVIPRPVEAIPRTLPDMAGYDGIIFSDIPAHELPENMMNLLRVYVDELGGGFLMIGGKNSFGVGGYYRTPIEEILPIKMQSPDKQEKYAVALCLVIDRSGSMGGPKIELAKSAASATVELLSSKDYMSVVAFDSSPTRVVPMQRVTSPQSIVNQISGLSAGGGTDIAVGMQAGRAELAEVSAKVKHMIVLSDGQSSAGYVQVAAALLQEGVTVSTVAIGDGADVGSLTATANAGGGQFYQTNDASTLPRIFTQDAMTHMGRLIREDPFTPQQVERNEMISGWDAAAAPPLMGYVKTHRKATAQVPLVTDLGDPLLATWRYGVGKVTAFTSDCKSKWGALWIASWPGGYSQFWAQVLRETARQPQGQNMDIHLTREGDAVNVSVNLLEDPASYDNDAEVELNINYAPADAGDNQLQALERVTLEQVGPGRYEGRFVPRGSGLYFAQARSGGASVTAGLVESISGEASTGRTDTPLLTEVTASTGGTLLAPDAASLPDYARTGYSHYVELRPYLLIALLLLFLIDVALRRWENVLAIGSMVGMAR